MTTTINASTSSGLVQTADTSGILQLQTANTAALTITAAQNVGIGTASPATSLAIADNATAANTKITISRTALGTTATYSSTELGTTTASPMDIITNGSTRMRVDASGNVGIGTTSPSVYSNQTTLTINGTTYGRLDLMAGGSVYGFLYAGSSGPSLASNGALPIGFETNGSERMRLTSSGYLGIGTTNPSFRLTVNGGTDNGIRVTDGTYSGTFNPTSLGGVAIGTDGAYPLVFGINASEKMRIDSSGNVLIGTTNASTSSGNGAKILSSGEISVVNPDAIGNFGTYELYSTNAGAYRFYITGAGRVFATNTTISAISDERLKENVRDLDIGLDAIMAVKPRRFDWKEGKGQDKKDAVGFIAQEFETVFPASVVESKAGDDGIEYKTICHEELIPTLVKAIQEQQAIISDLKARIETLENK